MWNRKHVSFSKLLCKVGMELKALSTNISCPRARKGAMRRYLTGGVTRHKVGPPTGFSVPLKALLNAR